MKENRTSVALVGVGGYGNVYLRALVDTPNISAELVAGVDPLVQPEVTAELKRLKIPVFSTMQSLYETMTPDLIVLASPLHVHADQACFALGHGSHVLCEKPLAATPTDAARMIDCRNKSNRILAVGYQWAFAPGVRQLKRDIASGRFGKPTHFRTCVYWPRSKAYYSRNNWAGKLNTPEGLPVLDSPVNNACAHYIQNMLYLLGESPDSTDWPCTVAAELYRANEIENYDTAVIRCVTCRGVELMIAVSHATEQLLDPTFEFGFEKAVVRSGGSDRRRIVATLADGEKIDYGTQPMGDNVEKLWQTIEAIREQTPSACGAEAAASHTALMYAAQRSSTPTSFPASDIVVTGENGTRTTVARGLDALLDRCYATSKLPSELGIAWACAGKTIKVEGLTGFDPL